MKLYITASKQVGDISYMVENIHKLYLILSSGEIWASAATEFNFSKNVDDHFVSFSRSKFSHAKLNPKWRVGVVLDGNKLSENIHIEPYSYAGTRLVYNMRFQLNFLEKIGSKYILSIVAHPDATDPFLEFEISETSYNKIVHLIETLTVRLQMKYPIQYKCNEDKSNILYRSVDPIKRGLPIPSDYFPINTAFQIFKHSSFNETEERAWGGNIDITKCVIGLILPEDYKEDVGLYLKSGDKDLIELLNIWYSKYDGKDKTFFYY